MRIEEREDGRKLVLTLVLAGKTTLKGKTYTANDSDGTVKKTVFGLSDDWYGGMVKEFRKIKGSKIMMCLDKRDRVINLAYVEEHLTNEDRVLLGLAVEEVYEPVVEEVGDSIEEVNEPVMDSIIDDTKNFTDEPKAKNTNVTKNGGKKK